MEANEALYERAVAGDQEAFWKLVLPYRGLIYSVAFGMLKSREGAEDQVHEVLVSAQGALANLRDLSKLPSWLYSITRHRILDLMRKEERMRKVISGVARAGAPVVPMAEMIETEAWLATMDEALSRLPEPFRVILAMKYMNDYSCQEIAEVLETTLPTVKSRLFQARKLLRKMTESLAEEKKGRSHEVQ